MKTEIMYATECAINVHFNHDSEFAFATWREHFKTLAEAIFYAESIFDTQGDAERIIIWDTNTGEILAECTPDPNYEESNFENENYDSDWGYNEDMGYDPYMGCYTDDC